jgi:hypothetical protein
VSLKELESWIERGQNVPFLWEKRPRKKCTTNIGADIGAITGILLTRLLFPFYYLLYYYILGPTRI